MVDFLFTMEGLLLLEIFKSEPILFNAIVSKQILPKNTR